MPSYRLQELFHDLREGIPAASISHLHTDSREPNVVVHTSDGTVYADGQSGTIDSGDASVPSDVERVLQAAFDAAGTIVSDGEALTVSNAVTLKSNTKLRGLHLNGSDSGRILELGTDVSNITVENCLFDGGHADAVTTADTLQDPLIDSASENDTGPYNDTNITFRNNEVRNHAGVAVDFDVVAHLRVTENYVHNVYAGISFQARHGVCDGNVVVGTADIGIDCGTSTDANQARWWVISNNSVFDCSSHAINVFGNPAHGVISGNVAVPDTAGAGGNSHGITVYDYDFGSGTVSPYQIDVVGNYVARADVHGIIVRSVTTGLPTGVDRSEITVKSNQVKGCDSNGIRVEAGADFNVTGNTANDCYNGVGVRDATRVNVRANYATGNQNGVFIDDTNTPTSAVVATNYLVGNTTGVSDAAAVAVTRDNDV